jgi:adenine-specific DNA-methyltransferase
MPQAQPIIYDVAREHKKRFGAVYTPTLLAEYVAAKTLHYFLGDHKDFAPIDKIRVVDPACGDGELLCATWAQLAPSLERKNVGAKVHKLLNPADMLYGIDISGQAVNQARSRLGSLLIKKPLKFDKNVLSYNALMPYKDEAPLNGWLRIMKQFDASDGFDLMIANPPWGAYLKDIEQYIFSHYSLSKGQYDSADLFIELALSIIKPGGYCGIIIPDSLFAFERSGLRELLLSKAEIKYIGRLGEKIFKDVNRACAVLIFKKLGLARNTNNLTDCFRLTPELRENILSSKMSFDDAERSLIHKVKQQRFAKNKNFNFDLDVREDEEVVLDKVKSHEATLHLYLDSTRGVELSKNGKVIQCRACGLWLALPTAKEPACRHCLADIDLSKHVPEIIVTKSKSAGLRPLIVGECISRYSISQPRWIDISKKGIKYKNDGIYCCDKILIRKTGVGISASIDYSRAYTNQVVYIFRLLDNLPVKVTLEFLLALINSRAMYYYLVKNHGETEWRSHPYITQKQILDLPIPEITNSESHQSKIDKVTSLIKPYLEANTTLPKTVDARIERLVASFYGLTEEDYRTIFETIYNVEDLLPVRALKTVQIKDIFES